MQTWVNVLLLALLQFSMPMLRAVEAGVINLDPKIGSYLIGPNSHVLVDQSRELKLSDAQQSWQEGKFQPELSADPNYGFTTFAYWYHFSAKHLGSVSKEWYFALEYPLINHVDLYFKARDGTWQHRDAGNAFAFDHRDLKNRFIYLKIDFDPNEQKEFFLRLQTDGSSEFRMSFKDLESIYRNDHDLQFYLGGCMGLLLILAAYYLLMTFNTKALDIMWLSIFMSSLFIFRMTINGFAFEYLWPDLSIWAQKATAFSVPLVFASAMTNAYYFLPIRNYPRFKMVCKIFMAINWILVVLSFFLAYRYLKVYTLIGIMTSAIIIAVSIYSQVQGFRPARYFVFAWSAMLIGSIGFGLQKLGIIPVTFLGTYGVELASIILAVLLSLGVSDKINETNKQLQIAQADALEAQIATNRLQEAMNSQLEIQVGQRTEELWRQTKGVTVLLDNVNQGICTIDAEFYIQAQHSKFLNQILDEKMLDNASLMTSLFDRCQLSGEMRDLLIMTVETAIGSDLLQFEVNAHLLPRLVSYSNNGIAKFLELDWAGVEDKLGLVEKILVTIRDVTAIRKVEENAMHKQKELEVISNILELSASKFQRFIKSTAVLIEESLQKLDIDTIKDNWHIILRNVHTIKGNARTYRLLDISALVHEEENLLFSIKLEKFCSNDIETTAKCLYRIEAIIVYYQKIHSERLKRGITAETEQLIVQTSKMMSDVWQDINAEKRKKYTQILAKLDALNTNSLKKLIQPILDSLPSIAQQLNKSTPEVTINGVDFFVEPDQLNFYEDIFVHMMRNSLDHGFILGEEGRIQIDIHHHKDSTELVFFDSGRGLNIPLLRKKAQEKKLISLDAEQLEVARTIFVTGVSSAKLITEISGRGVGMDAVVGCVTRLKGVVDVHLRGESSFAHYQRFEIRIILPPQNQILEALNLQQAA